MKKQKLNKNLKYSYIANNIRTKTVKTLKPILQADEKFIIDVFKYSTKPMNTYCDITGLPTQYLDPNSGCYYYNKDIYDLIKRGRLAKAFQWIDLKNVYIQYYPFSYE